MPKSRANFDSLNDLDRLSYIYNLNEVKDFLENINTSILKFELDDDDSEQETLEKTKKNSEYSNKHARTLVRLKGIANSSSATGVAASVVNSSPDANPNIQCMVASKPKIKDLELLIFDNDKNGNLEKFLFTLDSILDKYSLNRHTKFLYLQQQLKRSPKVLIDSLDVTEQSYDVAKDLLKQAFASATVQKFETIRKLTQMKLNMDGDPYKYIGEMKTISTSFDHLKIDTETILQYFFWEGLNDKFKDQFIQITNKGHPTLKEMKDNRYNRVVNKTNEYKRKNNDNKSMHEKSSTSKSLAGYATNVNISEKASSGKTFKLCSLCMKDGKKDVQHSLNACDVYKDAEAKVRKINDCNGCSRCGFLNHSIQNCKFRFNYKCFNCQAWHYSFLCTNKKPSNESSPGVKTKKENSDSKKKDSNAKKSDSNDTSTTASTITVVEVKACKTEKSYLPTFSCDLNNKMARILLDTGCEASFITREMLANYQFKI